METLTETLVARVDELVQQPGQRPLVWGNARLSTTPTSVAIREIIVRTEAVEHALREIALEVQKLVDASRIREEHGSRSAARS